MRSALLALLALAFSASADAQARFVNACIASAADEEVEVPFDPDQVCGCAASGAMSAGVAPADLDRLIDFVQDDNLELDALPSEMQAAGGAVMESLLGCVMSQTLGNALSGATSAAASQSAGTTPSTSASGTQSSPAQSVAAVSAPGAATSQLPTGPTGLRTGNGGGTVRTGALSPGAAIRIIE